MTVPAWAVCGLKSFFVLYSALLQSAMFSFLFCETRVQLNPLTACHAFVWFQNGGFVLCLFPWADKSLKRMIHHRSDDIPAWWSGIHWALSGWSSSLLYSVDGVCEGTCNREEPVLPTGISPVLIRPHISEVLSKVNFLIYIFKW